MTSRSKTEVFSINGTETGFSPLCRVITRNVRENRLKVWKFAIFTNKVVKYRV